MEKSKNEFWNKIKKRKGWKAFQVINKKTNKLVQQKTVTVKELIEKFEITAFDADAPDGEGKSTYFDKIDSNDVDDVIIEVYELLN